MPLTPRPERIAGRIATDRSMPPVRVPTRVGSEVRMLSVLLSTCRVQIHNEAGKLVSTRDATHYELDLAWRIAGLEADLIMLRIGADKSERPHAGRRNRA